MEEYRNAFRISRIACGANANDWVVWNQFTALFAEYSDAYKVEFAVLKMQHVKPQSKLSVCSWDISVKRADGANITTEEAKAIIKNFRSTHPIGCSLHAATRHRFNGFGINLIYMVDLCTCQMDFRFDLTKRPIEGCCEIHLDMGNIVDYTSDFTPEEKNYYVEQLIGGLASEKDKFDVVLHYEGNTSTKFKMSIRESIGPIQEFLNWNDEKELC